MNHTDVRPHTHVPLCDLFISTICWGVNIKLCALHTTQGCVCVYFPRESQSAETEHTHTCTLYRHNQAHPLEASTYKARRRDSAPSCYALGGSGDAPAHAGRTGRAARLPARRVDALLRFGVVVVTHAPVGGGEDGGHVRGGVVLGDARLGHGGGQHAEGAARVVRCA